MREAQNKNSTTDAARQDPFVRLHNHDYERAVIRGCLFDPLVFQTIQLTPQDFDNPHCRTIWEFFQDRAQRGELVDAMILSGELVDNELIPYSAYAAIMVLETGAAMAEAYAEAVLDLAERRRYMEAAQRLARIADVDSGDGWRERAGAMLASLLEARPGEQRATWTADELLLADFPEPRWAVPDLIPVGLTLFAGRPKIGKSWLALQLAQGVAAGSKNVLGRAVEAGPVLYLALEDSPRRLKQRMKAQNAPAGLRVTFKTDWRGLMDGGLEDLRAELQRGHESGEPYRLVIVDTLGRLLGGLDQRDSGDVTQLYGGLQRLAMTADVAIVGIEHHKKTAGQAWSDVISDIMESISKPGAADAILGIYRERGKREATLKATGRDLDDCELGLTWDAELMCWQYAGLADDVRADSEKGRVMDAIRKLDTLGELATNTAIADQTGMGKGATGDALADLLQAGKVRKAQKQGREQPYELV